MQQRSHTFLAIIYWLTGIAAASCWILTGMVQCFHPDQSTSGQQIGTGSPKVCLNWKNRYILMHAASHAKSMATPGEGITSTQPSTNAYHLRLLWITFRVQQTGSPMDAWFVLKNPQLCTSAGDLCFPNIRHDKSPIPWNFHEAVHSPENDVGTRKCMDHRMGCLLLCEKCSSGQVKNNNGQWWVIISEHPNRVADTSQSVQIRDTPKMSTI